MWLRLDSSSEGLGVWLSTSAPAAVKGREVTQNRVCQEWVAFPGVKENDLETRVPWLFGKAEQSPREDVLNALTYRQRRKQKKFLCYRNT